MKNFKILILFCLFFLVNLVISQSYPIVTWRFNNPEIQAGDTFKFDVELKCSIPGTFHSSTQIYFNYDTAAFGPTIVENNHIVYEKLELLNETFFGNPKYQVINHADNTPSRYAIVFEGNFIAPGSLFMTEVDTIFKGFIRFKIHIANPSEVAGIEFVSNIGNVGLMDFGQFHVDNSHPAETPYGVPPDHVCIYENNLLNFILTPSYSLDIKAFLEGPESGGQMSVNLNTQGFIPLNQPYSSSPWLYTGPEAVVSIPGPDIVDWLLLELRDAPEAALAVSSVTFKKLAVFLNSSGNIVDLDGINMPGFTETPASNLFVVIHHRNHLAAMSAYSLINIGNVYSYDFTSGADQAYGGISGHKEIAPGLWGMFSGDGNADGQVVNSDKLNVWSPQVGLSGYNAGDFNLDGNVGNADKIIYWAPNAGQSSQVPQ